MKKKGQWRNSAPFFVLFKKNIATFVEFVIHHTHYGCGEEHRTLFAIPFLGQNFNSKYGH